MRRHVGAAAARRAWPLYMTVVTLVTGMAYSVLWAPVVRHHSIWVTPGDLWGSFRGAHYVAWGDLGDIYGAHTGLVTFPGLMILLAPVSMLTSLLGLSEGFPLNIPHPSAWLVLGPVTMLMAAVPLCGLDALAESRHVSVARRRVLALLEGGAFWSMICLWGHPEDALAVGLLAYALAAGRRGAWRASGWLLGLAVTVQPLSLLALPTVLAWVPWRSKAGTFIRSVLPAGVLASLLLSSDFTDTFNGLTKQPNFPTVDHPTPWVGLSPSLGHGVVAAGPGRLLAVLVATAVGAWVWHRQRTGRPVDIELAVAAAFAARCFFEPVMVPYYVAPMVAFVLVVVADLSRLRLVMAALFGTALTVVVHTHAGETRYWLDMLALMAGLLACVARAPRASNLSDGRAPAPRAHRVGPLAAA